MRTYFIQKVCTPLCSTQLNVYMQRPFENLIRTVRVPSSTVVQFWVPLYINRTVYKNIWKHQGRQFSKVFWENCVLLRFRFEICEQDLKVRFHNLIPGDLLFLITIYAHRELYKKFKTYLFKFLWNFWPLKLLFTPITPDLDGHLWNCTPHLLLVILSPCSRLSLVNGHLFPVLLAS